MSKLTLTTFVTLDGAPGFSAASDGRAHAGR